MKVTSNELRVLVRALEFYQYEMKKTDNMENYKSWKYLVEKLNDNLEYNKGEFTLKSEIRNV